MSCRGVATAAPQLPVQAPPLAPPPEAPPPAGSLPPGTTLRLPGALNDWAKGVIEDHLKQHLPPIEWDSVTWPTLTEAFLRMSVRESTALMNSLMMPMGPRPRNIPQRARWLVQALATCNPPQGEDPLATQA